MSGSARVAVRELAAWGLDDYRFRPTALKPRGEEILKERPAYVEPENILALKNDQMACMMRAHADRPDLRFEMQGLAWSMEMVDLTCLLSFQRRLSFDPDAPTRSVPNPGDLGALVDLAFGPPKTVDFKALRIHPGGPLIVQSRDPNVQMRFAPANDQLVSVYGGSPFFEVALFRGRWFLRDGYHRAYCLLRGGFRYIPAVVVHAKTSAELGATEPWFFSEEVLFSDRPPRVTDFLDDRLNLHYTRPALVKTLRLTVEQSLSTEEECHREMTNEHSNQTR